MATKKEILDITKEIRDLLYQNDVEGYKKIPQYAQIIYSYIENKSIHDNIIYQLQQNFKAQSVIGLADVLVNIEKIIDNSTEDINEYMKASYVKHHSVDIENFEKNKSSILKKEVQIYNDFLSINNHCLDNDEDIIIDGSGNIGVNTKNGIVYLNSTVMCKNACDIWAKTLPKIEYYNTVIICGMSNMEYIRTVLSNVSDKTPIIVYEPDKKIFEYNYIYTDISDLLEQKNCFFIVDDINMKNLKVYINSFIGYVNFNNIMIYTLPGYDVLYFDKIKQFEQMCRSYLTDIKINNNSVVRWKDIATSNIIKNIQFLKNGVDIKKLKQKLATQNFDGIPAIIVAAGPSLDKNIKYLKEAKGKAMILAVDSAIRMMLKNNIMPDAFVTLDSDKERVLFENDMINNIPFFYSVHATYDAICNNRKARILYNNSGYMSDILKKFGIENDFIDSGGSVANSAFSVARYLGFKNIILIGQDLAFTNNKKHASVVYDEKPISEDEKNQYTTIEGIDGSQMLTYINFKVYRDWYEDCILQDEKLHVINATEGGALIHGAENMRFIYAIKKYCNEEFDFNKIISDKTLIYSFDNSDNIDNIYIQGVEKCDKIKEIYQECFDEYEKMGKNIDENSNKICYEKIKSLLDTVSKYSENSLIDNYAREVETNEAVGIYELSDKDDIWKDTAKRGMSVVKAYINGADEVKKLFENEKDINV